MMGTLTMEFLTNKFQNSSITKNMIYVASFPLIITLILSVLLVAPRVNQVLSYGALADSIKLATVLSSLLHEQQKERGASAVFLSTSGESFGSQLAKQRLETNEKRALLNAHLSGYLATLRDNQSHAAITAKLDDIQTTLARMNSIRSQIDTLDIETNAAIGYYTGLNTQILATIRHISQLSPNPQITISVISFANFLSGKERAGIERAIGSSGFSTGSFSSASLIRFDRLINLQDVYYASFLAEASEDSVRKFEAILASQSAQDLQRMRTVALTAGFGGDLQGVTGDAFFATATQKINLMKELENSLSNELLVMMGEKQSASRMIAFFSGGLAIAASFLSIGITLTISRLVRRNMIAVAKVATEMSGGHLEATLPDVAKSELGQIVSALDQFRQSIIAGQAREAKMRENEKTEQERKDMQDRQKQLTEKQQSETERRNLIEQRAAEQKITDEIAAVVSACAIGDFSQRINMANKDGVFNELCMGINQIAETTEANIAEIVDCIGALSEGNLGIRIVGQRHGAFQKMQDDFNTALARLSDTIAQIMQNGGSVTLTSEMLEQLSNDMAGRAEKNAASIEETSAAIQQFASSIHQVVTNSKAADEATQKVRVSADKSLQISNETEAAIHAMTEASIQINRVIKVIEDISFQINLLALNAGVEAARAGEAGRGFSVVASEVRALAQRSQDAVQEISTVILQNQKSVEAGVEKVGQSRKALEGIIAEVEVASTQTSHIAEAVEQQSLGVDEMKAAIRSIDSTAQTNAAAAEELTVSSLSLSKDATSLGRALDQFYGVPESEDIGTHKKVA